MFGPDYRTDLNLVFCDVQGNHLKPDSVTAKACLIAKRAGLNDTSLHTLRHSHGSQLLSAGVPLPTVSKRLGHSSVYVTATVYSHALAKDEIAAADAWDAAVETAMKGTASEKVS
jgi:integrase